MPAHFDAVCGPAALAQLLERRPIRYGSMMVLGEALRTGRRDGAHCGRPMTVRPAIILVSPLASLPIPN
jgi:hypothetical protein